MKLVSIVASLAIVSTAYAAEPLTLDIHPIDDFTVVTPGSEAPALQFLGGLHLRSDDDDFGGLSGIDVLGDGTVFMIGDAGTFVTGRFVFENERLTGLVDAAMGGLFPGGGTSKEDGDAEDIAFDPEDPARGVIVRERQANAMLSFEVSEGQPINFEPRRVGADDRLLRSNRGLESVAYAPPTSHLAGEIVTIAERPPGGETDIPAWIVGVGPFSIVRHDNFDISSARFLPNGDLLLLERRQQIGWGMRLRRIASADIAVGARLDGHTLIDAGMMSGIDNMEGLAVHQDEFGRTLLTVVSDDNHSILQRTILLQFALIED